MMKRQQSNGKRIRKPWKSLPAIPETIYEADTNLMRLLFNPQISLSVRLAAARRSSRLWAKFIQERGGE